MKISVENQLEKVKDDCSFTSYIMFYTVNFGSRNDDVIIGEKKG